MKLYFALLHLVNRHCVGDNDYNMWRINVWFAIFSYVPIAEANIKTHFVFVN